MADTPVLTQGQLANSTANIYTPSGAATATVLKVDILDTTGGNTINLWLKKSGGTTRKMMVFSGLAANQPGEWLGPFTLGNGDAIQGDATNANQVNFAVECYEHS